MKKIASFILAICTLCSVTACSFFPTNNSVDSESSVDTGYKLVDDGKSDYKLVIADDKEAMSEEEGAYEVQTFFKEATSVTLDVVFESQVSYSDDAKLIILGDTKFTEKTGVDVSEIPRDGFVLKTVDSNVFVLGENMGVIYGGYEFLTQTVGFEYFISNIYSIDKGVRDLDLPELDISDAPDFEYRADGWALGNTRTRTKTFNEAFIKPVGNPIHNSFDWLPKETYEEKHSSWYSTIGNQLCYTARGDETELSEMRATVLEAFKERVRVYFDAGEFDKNVINFTMEDNTSWCTCTSCIATANAYGGANSATIVTFLNPIARDLQAWVDVEYPGHEIGIVFFAYLATEVAPKNLEMEDNLYTWLCLTSADYLRSIHDGANVDQRQKLSSWSAISKKLFIWGYDTNFVEYMLWYDTFGTLQDFYRYLNSCGAEFVFNQGQGEESNYTNFDVLKAAINYRLMWDVDTDVDAFTNRFFEAYFKDAAKSMKAYYDSFRAWSAYLVGNGYSSNVHGGSRLFNGHTAEHYPTEKLNEWLGYIEQAYEDIAAMEETHPNRYKNIHNRIGLESIAVRYALIKLHNGSWEMKMAFKEDATAWKFTRKAEMDMIPALWALWGV